MQHPPASHPGKHESRVAPVAVILPAYNEEQTIADCIVAFADCLPEASIFIVNNGSSDSTAAIAEATMSRLGINGAVLHEFRRGKGAAVRRAFMEIQADVYLMADADCTYPAEAAPGLIAPVLSGSADMVVGDRLSGGHYKSQNKRPFHGLGNWLVCKLVNILFGARLTDIMSGYRAFSRTFVKTYPLLVEGFELETDLTLHALDKKFQIEELQISYKERPVGSESKLNTLSDGIRVVFTIFNIFRHFKPLLFFGFLGFVLALSSLLAGIPVFQDWLNHQYIYHLPLAVLATGLALASMLMLTVGLLLDTLVNMDRKRFEIELLNRSSDQSAS